jgi:hypothetical protein
MVMHVDGLRGRRARVPGRGALVHGHPCEARERHAHAEAQPDPARAEAQRAHLDGHVEDLEPTTPTDAIDGMPRSTVMRSSITRRGPKATVRTAVSEPSGCAVLTTVNGTLCPNSGNSAAPREAATPATVLATAIRPLRHPVPRCRPTPVAGRRSTPQARIEAVDRVAEHALVDRGIAHAVHAILN